MKDRIQLSDHFTYGRLIRFTLPSIGMMIFTSIYGVVDGFFVSNFAGKTPFAAVNLAWPFLMILSTVGLMFGTGGSAIVAKSFGEGDRDRANRCFSLFVYVAAAVGVVLAVLGIVFARPVIALLGSQGAMLENAVIYTRIILLALPFNVLQMLFQAFCTTAEKPRLGLLVTVASGITNMVLDAVLVILQACTNGSSEFMSNIAMSLVSMLYNLQLLHFAGEDGVAAYGVMMYVSMIFSAAFIGYSIGAAPIVSFHFGARNHGELQSLLRKSLRMIGLFGAAMVLSSQALALPLSKIFVGYDPDLMHMTASGFRIFGLSFLFMGYAIYASGFFTALSDGLTSALIAFLRTMVFQVAAVLLLPKLWELTGIWMSIVVAEFMAVVLSAIFLLLKRKKYSY